LHIANLTFAPQRGLQAEYFSGSRSATPALAGVDPGPSTASVQRRWFGTPPSAFTIRWYGFLTVDRPGRYTFAVTSDDGALLNLDGAVAIDNGGRHGLQTQQTTVDLSPGSHSVVIDFEQAGGGFAFEWQMAREGQPLRPVPGWRLTPRKVDARLVRAADVAHRVAQVLIWMAAVAAAFLLWQRRHWLPGHPRLASLAFFVLLAVIHTWPLASDVAHLTRHDNRDSMLNEWIISWVAHQLPRAPIHLFAGNIFYPERYTLAYSEPMIVQAVLGMPLFWMGASVVLTANLLLLAGLVLTGWATTLVVHRWTGDWLASLVAGSLFAFNAHSLSRIPHLQAQHLEFLPLAILALDRVLEAPTTRNALKLAGWFILQSLTSIYLLVIAAFALIASLLVGLTDVSQRPRLTLRALVIAGVISVAALIPFLVPYWFVSRELGMTRTLADAAGFAASISSYLSTPARVHSWWSSRFTDGNVLFPGVTGLLLAAVALLRGDALRDRRARMCIAVGVTGIALSFGAYLPGYSLLYGAMPLLRGIRATARFGILAIFAVAVLAAFGVTALRRSVGARTWRPLAVALVLAASLESIAAPLGLTRFEGIPPIYADLLRSSRAVVVEVPFYDSRSAQFHAQYMLNSTAHWQPLVNGYSGFQPPSFYENVEALQGFPDDRAFARLHGLGVTHLFVHGEQLPDGTLAMLDAREDLERSATFGSIAVYRLK
jgi:hypothetical protein